MCRFKHRELSKTCGACQGIVMDSLCFSQDPWLLTASDKKIPLMLEQ